MTAAHRMRTKPPMRAGAMLSAWYPLTIASDLRPAKTSCSLLRTFPNRLFTAQHAAAALDALLPMPLPSGRPLCSLKETPQDGGPPGSMASVSRAAMPQQFSSGSFLSLPPSPMISSMTTLPGLPSRMRASTVSPCPCRCKLLNRHERTTGQGS